MREPLYVLGNTIASLVTSLSCARHGRPVELLYSPQHIGGSFGGVTIGENRYDLGIRLFELDYEGSDRRSLSLFQPDIDSHRPFVNIIAEFINEICAEPLISVRPEMLVGGQHVLCPLMSVDLSELAKALSESERRQIIQQVSHLHDAALLENENLEDASLARHGKALHELLILPICAKQWARWPETIATERRKLWAALFHPSTIIEVMSGQTSDFQPYRPFSTFRTGQIFSFVDRLLAAIRNCPLIRLHPIDTITRIETENTDILITPQHGTTWRLPARDTISGLPMEQLCKALAIPFTLDRIVSSIAWARVSEAECLPFSSCLSLPGPETEAFRISIAAPGVFCLEFGAGTVSEEAVRRALEVSGAVRSGASITLLHHLTGAAQPAPTETNRKRFLQAHKKLETSGFTATLIGSARRFGWGSLNDHIIDGLYYGMHHAHRN